MKHAAGVAAAIYARYSTERQDARSIDDQVRRCRDYAERLGITVASTYCDAAISGSHLERPQLKLLLSASHARPQPFQIVLVDDLSRLSRDLGHSWNLVFEQLASVGVVVIDCSSGMRSDAPGARTMFAAMGMVNDTFLQLVRAETHRGLEGRALAGFWTGGRVYGYRTIVEPNPPDPEHPRMIPVIDLGEAAVVFRVFKMFLEGRGLKSIADQLNREGVPAPHDGGKGYKVGRGWGHTTIRSMLGNERYIGVWKWNSSKWLRTSNGKRRRLARPAAEHIKKTIPELSVVDPGTWERVQSRLCAQTRGGGRPAGVGIRTYLTSGLLRCGACGGSMSVVGQRMKAGVRYATFGCSAHFSRGSAICNNGLTISERRMTSALIESMRELFTAPDVVRRMTASIATKVERLTRPGTASTGDTITQIERRIANLTEALAAAPASAAILDKLAQEERRLASARESQRAELPIQGLKAPTEQQVGRFLADLVTTLRADPAAGRQVLADIMSPVTLTPKTAPRGYQCRAEFRLPGTLEAVGSAASVLEKVSSGGSRGTFISLVQFEILGSWQP